ncbi:MAG: S8 family serine peptidase, partial [Chloroflexota bacterium]
WRCYTPRHMVWPSLRTFLRVPENLTGKGIRIALVDGSFASHPDVASNGTRQTFLVNIAAPSPSPALLEATPSPEWFKGGEHGTWAAAAAAGSGALSGGVYAGLAPEADFVLVAGWVPHRPHRPGATAVQDRVASLEWVRRHWREYGIRAVLTSHAEQESALLPWQTEPQRRVAEALAAEGVLVVAGTGNVLDVICHVGVAAAPSTLAVGGVVLPEQAGLECIDVDHAVAYHGSRGTTFEGKWVPEVLAPAENVVLPYLTDGPVRDHFYADSDAPILPRGYARTEGASFSGPVVLGAAACVWQAHPAWTAGQVAAALVRTAIHQPHWAALRAGLLSVAAAVEAAPDLASAQEKNGSEMPFARWQAWRRQPVATRLASVRGSDPKRAVEAFLSFLPDEAPPDVLDVARGVAADGAASAEGRRRTAALCVLATQPAALTSPLLASRLDDPDAHVRAAAIHALGRRPDLWHELVAPFRGAVNDPHPDVRHRALLLAAKRRDPQLVPALVAGLDEDVRLGTANLAARCTALTAATGVRFPEEPTWVVGECRYTERRRQARAQVAASWQTWFADHPAAV